MSRVGVLAIQGDVAAHARILTAIGAEPVPVLREEQLPALDALILPGGESTTISKGMDRLKLWDPIRAFARSGRPLLGTCAGGSFAATPRLGTRLSRSRHFFRSGRWAGRRPGLNPFHIIPQLAAGRSGSTRVFHDSFDGGAPLPRP